MVGKLKCVLFFPQLDVLEYIHSKEYVHADIKASNLLIGHKTGTENQVFLVDFGLARYYANEGRHKEYKYDQRKAHDGTIEFTSRDAHIGGKCVFCHEGDPGCTFLGSAMTVIS